MEIVLTLGGAWLLYRLALKTGEAVTGGISAFRRGISDRRANRRLLEQSARLDAEHRKREDRRAACVFLYEQHAHRLAERLPKERFETMLGEFFADTQPLAVVENRAAFLENLIQVHVRELQPAELPGATGDVEAARSEVQAFYQEHPEVHQVCPPRRFQAEIRARIPDTASSAEAWKEARDIIKDILDLSVQENQRAAPPAASINPPLGNI